MSLSKQFEIELRFGFSMYLQWRINSIRVQAINEILGFLNNCLSKRFSLIEYIYICVTHAFGKTFASDLSFMSKTKIVRGLQQVRIYL